MTRENGIAANPSSLGTPTRTAFEGEFSAEGEFTAEYEFPDEGEFPAEGSARGSTKIGRASARNAKAGPPKGSMPPPGTAGRGDDGALERGSGVVFLSGVVVSG